MVPLLVLVLVPKELVLARVLARVLELVVLLLMRPQAVAKGPIRQMKPLQLVMTMGLKRWNHGQRQVTLQYPKRVLLQQK